MLTLYFYRSGICLNTGKATYRGYTALCNAKLDVELLLLWIEDMQCSLFEKYIRFVIH